MLKSNTNSVQSFVRLIAFLIVFVFLSIIVVAPLAAISSTLFNGPLILALPSLVFVFWLSSILAKTFYILPQWESMVVLRLGKFDSVKGAGFFFIPPFIYSVAQIIDMRIVTQQVEATATLTMDNVPTKVTAAVEYKVENAQKAVIDVYDYRSSVIWLSTEALKNTIGSLTLKDLLSERDQIADSLKVQIDQGAATYGVDVKAVRITDIDTPQSLIEELAVIARAKRAAEAKQIQAEAEVLVAKKISEASVILNKNNEAMRLRELQILSDMSKEESSMIIIYPYGDRSGQEIANSTAGSSTQKITPQNPEKNT